MELSNPSIDEFRFDAGVPPNLAAVRRWVRFVLRGAAAGCVEDALLLATELVSNALDHAQGVRALRVLVRDPESTCRLEIDDGRPDLGLHVGESSVNGPRGRGLLLVDAISRRWGVVTHDGGYKTVWVDIAAG